MYGHTNPTYHVTDDGDRLGPKMRSAVKLMYRRGQMPSKNKLAKHVGPNGSQDYGYRIVDRCIRAGLLEVDPDSDMANPHGMGAVKITDKGMDVANKILANQQRDN